MATAVTVGTQNRVLGTGQAVQSLTQSTATAVQSVSLTSEPTTLGMGTSTGFMRNRYLLAAGHEGLTKLVYVTGTGEAYMDVAGGTATGGFVFTDAQDFELLRYFGSGWMRVGAGNATIATATNS